MVKQQEVQTLDAIFRVIFNAESRVKCYYNKINRSTPFIYRLAAVLAESE